MIFEKDFAIGVVRDASGDTDNSNGIHLAPIYSAEGDMNKSYGARGITGLIAR